MAFDQGLAQRVREGLDEQDDLSEKKMFGGIGFLLRGNMCCGVIGDELIVRVGPALHEEALGRPGARPFDFTGRPMKGWVMVAPPGYEADDDLSSWIGLGTDLALSLPPK